MGKPRFSETIPPRVRDELDARIRESGYGRYHDHAKWLTEHHGCPVKKTAVALYGKALRDADRAARRPRSASSAEQEYMKAALAFEYARQRLIEVIQPPALPHIPYGDAFHAE